MEIIFSLLLANIIWQTHITFLNLNLFSNSTTHYLHGAIKVDIRDRVDEKAKVTVSYSHIKKGRLLTMQYTKEFTTLGWLINGSPLNQRVQNSEGGMQAFWKILKKVEHWGCGWRISLSFRGQKLLQSSQRMIADCYIFYILDLKYLNGRIISIPIYVYRLLSELSALELLRLCVDVAHKQWKNAISSLFIQY